MDVVVAWQCWHIMFEWMAEFDEVQSGYRFGDDRHGSSLDSWDDYQDFGGRV